MGMSIDVVRLWTSICLSQKIIHGHDEDETMFPSSNIRVGDLP